MRTGNAHIWYNENKRDKDEALHSSLLWGYICLKKTFGEKKRKMNHIYLDVYVSTLIQNFIFYDQATFQQNLSAYKKENRIKSVGST